MKIAQVWDIGAVFLNSQSDSGKVLPEVAFRTFSGVMNTISRASS